MVDALIVVAEFMGHARGTVITDPMYIETILESEFARFVVKTQIPA
jgi:hypothetical protein